MFPPNIDCGCLLEPHHRDGSNNYPHPMFLSQNNKKIMHTPFSPNINWGFPGASLHGLVNVMYVIFTSFKAVRII